MWSANQTRDEDHSHFSLPRVKGAPTHICTGTVLNPPTHLLRVKLSPATADDMQQIILPRVNGRDPAGDRAHAQHTACAHHICTGLSRRAETETGHICAGTVQTRRV